MPKSYTFKLTAPAAFLLILCTIILTLQSCKKKKRSDLGKVLYEKTKNKIFKDATPEGLAEVFKKVLEDEKGKLTNPKLITAFYADNDYEPVFILNHVFNGDADTAAAYLGKAGEHGLDPKIYKSGEIKALADKFKNKKGFKTLNEAYHDIAELEITAANSLIDYSSALQFGLINPHKIYARYYIPTKRPDSASMSQIFHIKDLKNYLDSIQPKDAQYLALKKALAGTAAAPGTNNEQTRRYLIVNLERLRWKNKPSQGRYVIVNIPDYRLDVIDSGKSILNMKVCVGQGRNMNNANTLTKFDDSTRFDKPFIRETPQLSSVIHSVQVNPVWNIPQSIASKEIMVEAAQDRYYLSNKNIDVYENGKLVEDPETINWSSASKDKYEFKQRPGDDNSLGKIKFLFKNKSSVYLHDTPAKDAFNKKMRAVSHGCVRLGNPQGLAKELFGDGEDYETIAKGMASDNPKPTTIDLPGKTPVYITYYTCWADENGTLQYRPDVYGLDIVLYAHLEKLLTTGEPLTASR